MKCPICGTFDTKVLESRESHEGRAVRRRRCCTSCNHRFTTYEKEEEFSFSVVKKDGNVEAYQRNKLFRAIQTACQKRPVTYEQIDTMVAKIERQVQESGERSVASQKIGDLVMSLLLGLDKVAYVRFASVYKDFQDPTEFMNEIRSF